MRRITNSTVFVAVLLNSDACTPAGFCPSTRSANDVSDPYWKRGMEPTLNDVVAKLIVAVPLVVTAPITFSGAVPPEPMVDKSIVTPDNEPSDSDWVDNCAPAPVSVTPSVAPGATVIPPPSVDDVVITSSPAEIVVGPE